MQLITTENKLAGSKKALEIIEKGITYCLLVKSVYTNYYSMYLLKCNLSFPIYPKKSKITKKATSIFRWPVAFSYKKAQNNYSALVTFIYLFRFLLLFSLILELRPLFLLLVFLLQLLFQVHLIDLPSKLFLVF